MSEFVRYEPHGGVALLVVENPPVNALSHGVPEAIEAAIARAAGQPDIRAVVLAGAGRTFIAGADIRELTKPAYEPYVASVNRCAKAIEDSIKPVVMAIHGTAFGGGLEIAMAGHYRLMAANAQAGQPEVKLGLIPGAGGTQRLPRLVGCEAALEMCALGEPVTAQAALSMGLVDRLIEGDLISSAIEFAVPLAETPLKTRDRVAKLRHATAFDGMRERARNSRPGELAPLLAVDAVEAAVQIPFDQGLQREAELFRQCWSSSQSRALIYLFFAERAAAKFEDHPSAQNGNMDVTYVDHPNSRLVEIVRDERTSPESVRAALERAKKAGKVGVVVNGIVNERLWNRYRTETSAGSNESTVMQALADEGAQLVRSGIVSRESDIDLIWTLGYGFPAWRGGPMFWSRENQSH